MDLFNPNPISSILPYDGTVEYYGQILPYKQAMHYFDQLFNQIEWEHDKAIIQGKLIVTKRKVAWYADRPFTYTYSHTTKKALPWIKELLELKLIIEEKTGETFNSCLLNLYHNGSEGMTWHSDGETDLKKNGAIASLSLGATRKFSLKHKREKQTVSVTLEKGSLLVMKGTTQSNWLHSVPQTKKVNTPRISLTFRTVEQQHY